LLALERRFLEIMGLREIRVVRDRVLISLGVYCLYCLQRGWLNIESFTGLEAIIGRERYREIINFLQGNRVMGNRPKPRIDLSRLSELVAELESLKPGGEPPDSILNFIRENRSLIRQLRIDKKVGWRQIAEVLNRYNLERGNPLTGKKLQTYWGLVFPDDKEVYDSPGKETKGTNEKKETKGWNDGVKRMWGEPSFE